jgi:hypothetical protein
MLPIFQTVGPMVDATTITMEAFLEDGERGLAVARSTAVTGEPLEAIEEFLVRDGKIARIRVFMHNISPMVRAHAAVHGG